MSQKKPSECCHPDCHKCPYPDCIWDGMDILDYQNNLIDDLANPVDRKTQMSRARANRYAERHREQIRKTSFAWYYAHHEEQKARSRKWQNENKDRVAAAKRKRWAENPEYYRQKQREYRERKRKEVG